MFTPLVGLPLMGPPGIMEWLLIGLALLLFFGASRLPKMGHGLGEGIRNFKKALKGAQEDDSSLPAKQEPAGPRPDAPKPESGAKPEG